MPYPTFSNPDHPIQAIRLRLRDGGVFAWA